MAASGQVSGGSSVQNAPSQTGVRGASATGSSNQSPSSAAAAKAFGSITAKFPSDLETSSSGLYMNIAFQEYQRRSIFDRPFLSPAGQISLPIPDNLNDQQAIRYEEVGAGPAVGAALEQTIRSKGEIYNNFREGNYSAVGAEGAKIAGATAIGGLEKLGTTAVDRLGAAAGSQQTSAQLLQLGGMSVNPFLTVLFKQPTFKTHIFSWRFFPRNAYESFSLSDIITQFRYNMLPSMVSASGGTLLKYPNMANISFSNDSFLYKFKPCVLEDVSFDFTGMNNIPSFFKGTGAPVSVRITAQFKEIEYWLKEDIFGDRGAGSNQLPGPNQYGPNPYFGPGQNTIPK